MDNLFAILFYNSVFLFFVRQKYDLSTRSNSPVYGSFGEEVLIFGYGWNPLFRTMLLCFFIHL